MTAENNTLNIKNLQPGEEVKVVLRRHWFALVWVFGYFAFGLALAMLMFLFGGDIPLIGFLVNIILVIFLSVFILLTYIFWMRYELDIYIITNKRIIGLEEVAFLDRHISECALEKVQEVNAKTNGFWSNMLNFGEVTIHTASETSDFNMVYMPDAFENARNISNIIAQYKPNKNVDNNI